MEALERVKLEGFDMVLAELQVELDFLAGPRGIWRSRGNRNFVLGDHCSSFSTRHILLPTAMVVAGWLYRWKAAAHNISPAGRR